MALSLCKNILVLVEPSLSSLYPLQGGVGYVAPDGSTIEDFANPVVQDASGNTLIGTDETDTPHVFETGVPIFIPNVISVSNNFPLNAGATGSITLTNSTRGVLYSGILDTLFQRLQRRKRPYVSAGTESAPSIYADYYPEVPEGEANDTSVLGQLLKDCLAIPDFDPSIPLGDQNVALNRQMLAQQSAVTYPHGGEYTPEYFNDLIQYIYDLAVEDHRRVFVFVQAPPRSWLGETSPSWVRFFTGYAVKTRTTYTGRENYWETTIDLAAPSELLRDSQLKTNYVVVNWLGESSVKYSNGGTNQGELADAFQQVLATSNGAFPSYLSNYWQGKSMQEILHLVASLANSSRTFLGYKLLQTSVPSAFGGGDANSPLAKGVLPRSYFYYYDTIYAAYRNAPAKVGVIDVNGVFPLAGVSSYTENADLPEFFPSAGAAEPSPYLWHYRGEALTIPADIVDFLQSIDDPKVLGQAWWFGYEDATTGKTLGPIRDMLAPRILVDDLLANDSVFAKVIIASFALNDTGARKAMYDTLLEAADRIGVSLMDDPGGNLCVFVNRYDDLPARWVDGTQINTGWCPYDELGGGFLLTDHDNRYLVGRANLNQLTEEHNSQAEISMASAVAEADWIQGSVGADLSMMAQTGFSQADYLTQTRLGSRCFKVNTALLRGNGFSVDLMGGQETVKALMTTFATHVLRITNAKARSGSTVLTGGRGLWMMPGRNAYFIGLQRKGYITAISTAYDYGNPNEISSNLSLMNMSDIGYILGNPYLEYQIRNPAFSTALEAARPVTVAPTGTVDDNTAYSRPTDDGVVLNLLGHENELKELVLVSLGQDPTMWDVQAVRDSATAYFRDTTNTSTVDGPGAKVSEALFAALTDMYNTLRDNAQAVLANYQTGDAEYALVVNPLPILAAFSPPGHTLENDINGLADCNRGAGNSHWGGNAVYFNMAALAPVTGVGQVFYITKNGEPFQNGVTRTEVDEVCSTLGMVAYDSNPGHYCMTGGASKPKIEGAPEAAAIILAAAAEVDSDPAFQCLVLAIADIESSMGEDSSAMNNPPNDDGSLGLYQLTVADVLQEDGTYDTWDLPNDAERGIFVYSTSASTCSFVKDTGTRRIYQWSNDPRLDITIGARLGVKYLHLHWVKYMQGLQGEGRDFDGSSYVKSLDDVIMFTAVAYNAGAKRLADYKGVPPKTWGWNAATPYPDKMLTFFPKYGGVWSNPNYDPYAN